MKKRGMIKLLPLLLVLALLLTGCAQLGKWRMGPRSGSVGENGGLSSREGETEAWNLILVSRDQPLPEEYTVELAAIERGYSFDARAAQALTDFLDGARAAGLKPLICSAYRTEEVQTELYGKKVDEFLAQGNSREQSEQLAAEWVLPPGTSEHQLGLAADIVSMDYQLLDEKQADTPEQQWLMAHCAEYGFILRYPAEKNDVTGVAHEPWHYRYVGVEAAQEITQAGLCLEEYLEEQDHADAHNH